MDKIQKPEKAFEKNSGVVKLNKIEGEFLFDHTNFDNGLDNVMKTLYYIISNIIIGGVYYGI